MGGDVMQPESMSSSDEAQQDNSVGSSYAERRKSSKPIMEKRRRARINNSLNELKTILLEALKKDSTRHSKLEKADILEMTVKYLKNVERQRLSVSLSIDPTVVDKYRAGFNECRNEVMKFLSTCEGVTVDVRTRLLSHLAACLQAMQSQTNMFEDSLMMDSPPFQSTMLQNGNTQAIQVRFPDSTATAIPIAVGSVNSGTYTAAIAPRPSVPLSLPTFDAQLPVNSRTHARNPGGTSIVLTEGTRLTSTINGLNGGNIAVLIPPTVTDTTSYFAPASTPHQRGQKAAVEQRLTTPPSSPPSGTQVHYAKTSPYHANQIAEPRTEPCPGVTYVDEVGNAARYEHGAATSQPHSKLSPPLPSSHTDTPFRASVTIAENVQANYNVVSQAGTSDNRLSYHETSSQRNCNRTPPTPQARQAELRNALATDTLCAKRYLDDPHITQTIHTSQKRLRTFENSNELHSNLDEGWVAAGALLSQTVDGTSRNRIETPSTGPRCSPQQTSPSSAHSHETDSRCATSALPHAAHHRSPTISMVGRNEPWRPWSKSKLLGKDV